MGVYLNKDDEPKVGVVLLAAGASSRMGRPKLLLPWKSTTILGHLLEQWRNVGAHQIAVVCAASDQLIQVELDRLRFPPENRILNSNPSVGMHSSIRCAAEWDKWDAKITHFAIALGDQPQLQTQTLRALIQSLEGEMICQPSRGGRGRHPVILARRWFREIPASSMQTLKEFLTLHADAVLKIEMDDAGLDVDLDRPEDYEAARGRWGG